MARMGSNRSSRSSSSIAEAQYMTLGGGDGDDVEQWVLIRGNNVVDNPVMIMLHGGPGIAETTFWRYCNSKSLEEAFTVVYWDQRGSGKSYHHHHHHPHDGDKNKTVPKESMTVSQFLRDLDALVNYVCHRFHKSQVILFGHSWGTVLGPLYAAQHANNNKVSMYIGCAQLGDWSKSEQTTFDYVLQEAKRRQNHRAISELQQKVGPPPHDTNGLCTQRKWLAKFDGDMTLVNGLKMLYMHMRVPESSIGELFSFWKVLRFSIDCMWSEVTSINLITAVPELTMPCIFLLGKKDHCVSNEISMEFITNLKAPAKEIVWFEESKHLPFMDEPTKFNRCMVEMVKPMWSSLLLEAGRNHQ